MLTYDCLTIKDDIQRSDRRDIDNLPDNFEEAFVILDNILTNDEKNAIKCANERQLLTREVFPDIWMWSFNAFKIGNRESFSGIEIKEKGIHQLGSSSIAPVGSTK